jgi:hypothetical protein
MNPKKPNSMWNEFRAMRQSPRPPDATALETSRHAEPTPEQQEMIRSAIRDARQSYLIGIREQEEFRHAIASGIPADITLIWNQEGMEREVTARVVPDPKSKGSWQLFVDGWPADAGELKHLFAGAFELNQFPKVSGMLMPEIQDADRGTLDAGASHWKLAADSGDDEDDAFRLPFAAANRERPDQPTNFAKSVDGEFWDADGRLFFEADVTGDQDSAFALVELFTMEVPARRLATAVCEMVPPEEEGHWKGQTRLPAPATVLKQSGRMTVRPLAIEDVGWLLDKSETGLPQTTSFLGGQEYRATRLEKTERGYKFSIASPIFQLPEVGVCLSAVRARKEVR